MDEQIIDLIYNITGIIGVSLIIITYFLLQAGKMKGDDLLYPLINLVGAIMVLISLYRFYNLASVIIEIFWIIISIYGIFKALKKRNKT